MLKLHFEALLGASIFASKSSTTALDYTNLPFEKNLFSVMVPECLSKTYRFATVEGKDNRIHRCPVSCTRSAQNFVGRKIIKINILKEQMGYKQPMSFSLTGTPGCLWVCYHLQYNQRSLSMAFNCYLPPPFGKFH